jgi:CHAD domain-containing protein
MTVLDPTTPLGKIRLRIGDWHDLVILPDSVIQSALDDCQSSVPRAAALCAQYILATLTAKTHRSCRNLKRGPVNSSTTTCSS